jgi:hypothetical protein
VRFCTTFEVADQAPASGGSAICYLYHGYCGSVTRRVTVTECAPAFPAYLRGGVQVGRFQAVRIFLSQSIHPFTTAPLRQSVVMSLGGCAENLFAEFAPATWIFLGCVDGQGSAEVQGGGGFIKIWGSEDIVCRVRGRAAGLRT